MKVNEIHSPVLFRFESIKGLGILINIQHHSILLTPSLASFPGLPSHAVFLLGLFGVVCTTWLVPGNPFAPLGLNSNYDRPDYLAIDPSHTVHLQGHLRQCTPLHHLVCNFWREHCPWLQFLIACSMQKTEGEGLVNLTTWSAVIVHAPAVYCILLVTTPLP